MNVVVITGASRGIGRATALLFARNGWRLALLARDEEALREVARACGGEALCFKADVTDAARLGEIAGEVVNTFGRIDAWINNAGVGAVGQFEDTPLADHRRVIDVNLGGYLNGAHAALGVFTRQKFGVLVNVASISAYIPQPTSVAYVTSKFAIRGMSYALRQDLAAAGLKRVQVALVHPQVVATDVFKHMANFSGRAVEIKLPKVSPERVARVILSQVRRPRREKVVGFFGWIAVLGHRFFPGISEVLMIALGKWYFRRVHSVPKEAPNDGNLFDKTDGPPGRGATKR